MSADKEKLVRDQEKQVRELEKKLAQVGLDNQQKLSAMEEEYDKKLNQSQAVASMKQIIKDKNAQINQLRERLSKYEKEE